MHRCCPSVRLFVCLSVCLLVYLSVCCQNAKSAIFSKTKQFRAMMSIENLSPRLLAEPWRLEGRCVRAGGNESQRRLSSAVSPVYSTRTNMHYQYDAINPAFVRTFYYNVTAIPSPRCVRSSRQRTGQTRRSPALSSRAQNSNSKEE